MTSTKEHIKVLSTLSLAASDTREDTLTSILINTVFQAEKIKRPDLIAGIQELYGFEPYKDEVIQLFEKLVDDDRITKDSNEEFALSESEVKRFQEADLLLKDKEKSRFNNFKSFLDEIDANVETSQAKLIWATFVEYLYNNFYEFGEDALKRFHPHIRKQNIENNDLDFFQAAYQKLKDEQLCKLFKQTVEKFSDYASSDDVDFLNDLAQKTLCFASLGIDPKLASNSLENSLVDWTLYLDTNVLYSLLNLHSHPENEACKALIHLIKDNKKHIKIVLRYSELTKKELNAKKDDFQLLDDTLTDSGIKALLKSENLDDFSRQFYGNLLASRDSTLHPSKVIELSPNTLLRDEIDISRNQKRVEKIGDAYLNIRIQDYRKFIDDKNALRLQYNKEKNATLRTYFRSDKQIVHDITLREIILDQRNANIANGTIATLNSVKYFGITLDSLLLDYDSKDVKDYNDSRSFPVFFRPSFLLNQLVRVLPIKTDDYKKAFLKAVTSKGFNKDVQKSYDILKIVNYLKSQGIDDEQIIYNLISEELFLEKYRKNKNNPDFNQGEFIESELNREFKKKEEELQKTKEALLAKERETTLKTQQTESLSTKKGNLETELELYKKSLKKLQNEIKKLENRPVIATRQPAINFEVGTEKAEVKKLRDKLIKQVQSEIADYKEGRLAIWQKRVWWNLLWAIPLTVAAVWIIFFPSIIPMTTVDTVTIRFLMSSIVFLLDGLFLMLIKMRYWDEGNKQKKLENIKAPDKLNTKLSEVSEE
jgi:hypothetical protein